MQDDNREAAEGKDGAVGQGRRKRGGRGAILRSYAFNNASTAHYHDDRNDPHHSR